WSLLFFIVIGLLSCELILSGMISRERFGIQQVAEGSESWAGMDSPDHAAEPGSFPVNTGSTTRPLHTTSPLQVSGSELN
ncbi:MAG: hypothetical protein KDA78_03930, partial [Planctomycetaceae bacterium]|nr:hypothetical protein [Planctomycetaceae bacterium]